MTHSDKIFYREKLKEPARFLREEPHRFRHHQWKGARRKEFLFWLFLFFALPLAISLITGWTP